MNSDQKYNNYKMINRKVESAQLNNIIRDLSKLKRSKLRGRKILT